MILSAAPISYAYRLQPGELDFTIDSTALNAQVLALSLQCGGC